MSNGLMIAQPLAISAVTVSDGTGAGNLLTPSPREIWRSAAVGATNIDLDFGAAAALDTVFIGFGNASASAVWSIATMTDAGGAGLVQVRAELPIRVPGAIGTRQHGLALLAAPVTTRFLRISVNQVTGANPMQIGVVVAGLRIERAYEYRAGRGAIDLSRRTELQDGGFAIERGVIKSSFRFTLADLDDGAVEELWRVVTAVGEQSPLLIVEGHESAPLFTQIHYGLFERLEPYEREDPAQTKWGLSIRDWV